MSKLSAAANSAALGVRLKEKAEFFAVYYKRHNLCQVCHAHSSERTMAGFIFDPRHPERYRDENDVRCKCGWRGTVHDLVET